MTEEIIYQKCVSRKMLRLELESVWGGTGRAKRTILKVVMEVSVRDKNMPRRIVEEHRGA